MSFRVSLCFTGGLRSMTRREASKAAREQGFAVSNHVAKSTDYLIIGCDLSRCEKRTKIKEAKSLGVATIDECQFIKLLGIAD